MSSFEILQQGIDLLVLGMGSVFVFLAVLVVGTAMMSAIIMRWFPDSVSVDVPRKRTATTEINSKTLSIIEQAIAQHRVAKGRSLAE